MTNDRRLQAQQLDKLLDVVDSVCANNGGKPFSDQMFTRIKVNGKFVDIRVLNFSSYYLSRLV
jgi:hypothetical protein